MIYYTTKKDSLSILFLFRKKPAGACTHLPDALFCRLCLPSEAKEISNNKGICRTIFVRQMPKIRMIQK